MKHEIVRSPGLLEVKLSGRLNYDDHDSFRSVLDLFREQRLGRIVLDLSRLEAIDSAGLGMLIISGAEAERHQVKLEIRNPQGLVRRLMELGRLDKHLGCVYG